MSNKLKELKENYQAIITMAQNAHLTIRSLKDLITANSNDSDLKNELRVSKQEMLDNLTFQTDEILNRINKTPALAKNPLIQELKKNLIPFSSPAGATHKFGSPKPP